MAEAGNNGALNKLECEGIQNPPLEVNRVSIRTPPFSKDRPALWFASLEAQFSINQITRESTKFSYAISLLDTNCACEVEDIIISPPQIDPYTTLKKAIISRFSDSYEEKIRRLLEKEQIGDRKPTSFLRHLRSLAGPAFPDQLLRSIWSSRLPRQLQVVLAAQRIDQLGELAELADTLMDIQAQPNEVCSTTVYASPAQEPNAIAALQQQVAELTRAVAALTATGGPSGVRSRGRSANRSRSRSRSRPRNPDLCWYHDRYANKAQKCTQPCTWSDNSGNLNSGR